MKTDSIDFKDIGSKSDDSGPVTQGICWLDWITDKKWRFQRPSDHRPSSSPPAVYFLSLHKLKKKRGINWKERRRGGWVVGEEGLLVYTSSDCFQNWVGEIRFDKKLIFENRLWKKIDLILLVLEQNISIILLFPRAYKLISCCSCYY